MKTNVSCDEIGFSFRKPGSKLQEILQYHKDDAGEVLKYQDSEVLKSRAGFGISLIGGYLSLQSVMFPSVLESTFGSTEIYFSQGLLCYFKKLKTI